MQTILGGNGTIGKILATELKKYTDRVRLVSRNPKKVNEDDELMSFDLSEGRNVEKAIIGSEIVYLVVGFEYNLKVWQKSWAKLMRAVMDACIKHNAKLVFFDNVYLYDENEMKHMTEQSKINPPSRKGDIRLQVAGMLMNEIRIGKLQALIARSADFYGPDNDKSYLVEVVYKNFLKNNKANWFVNADVKHSFTYTPDAAKATALLGNTPDAYGQVWHLPTAQPLTGKEWVSLFAKHMEVKPRVTVLPLWFIKLLGVFIPFMKEMPEMLYQYDRDYYFDSSKFEKRFGIHPTSPEQAVREIVLTERQ